MSDQQDGTPTSSGSPADLIEAETSPSWIGRCFRGLFQFLAIHLWTLATGAIGTAAILYLPQVSNLWRQRPYGTGESLGFGLFLLVLMILYPVTLLWLWQRSLFQVWKPHWHRALIRICDESVFLRLLTRVLFLPSRLLTAALTRSATVLVVLSRGMMGAGFILLVLSVGFYLNRIVPLNLNQPYLMCGGFLRMTGLWLLLVGIWLIFGYFFGPESMVQQAGQSDVQDLTQTDRRRRVWHATGRVLSWIASASLFGEVLWICAYSEVPFASYRLYTIWAAFHIPLIATALAALVDFAQQHTRVHARMIVGVLLLGWAAFPHLTEGNAIRDPLPNQEHLVAAEQATQSKPESDAAETLWLDSLEQRIEEVEEGPIVIVAASGGGSRAALFTSLVLQHLSRSPMEWPLPPDDSPSDETSGRLPEQPSTDSTAAPPDITALNDSSVTRTWADQIVLISSVSGGSLATARFSADPEIATQQLAELRYSTQRELRERTLHKLNTWAADPKDPLSESAQSRAEREHLQQVIAILRGAPDTTAGHPLLGAFSSRLADDMAADFMAPILRGVLTPHADRGDTLFEFWSQQYGWSALAQTPGKCIDETAGTDGTSPRARQHDGPLILLNSTDVETGRRVVLGYPPLPRGFLPGTPRFPDEVIRSNGIQTRSQEFGPLSFSDFASDETTQLSLTRGVRLSSNFPWGFGVEQFSGESRPSVRFHVDAPTVRGSDSRKVLELVDGGVVDNTGIDSVAALFESLRLRAETDPFGREARIVHRLRQHGMVFIEIDSGAKPTGSRAEGTAFGELIRPLTALNNSAYINALRISDNLIQQLLLRLAVPRSSASLS
ncbi:MAG: patatin-like phospholipase family protein, partial [Planctomycetaceae bacterium]|nr:patatin-like phospholipase family protein [Planctomycetaceae bacterium]